MKRKTLLFLMLTAMFSPLASNAQAVLLSENFDDMTWGFNDNTCPPTTCYAVWNLLQCEKESLITPVNEHWTSEATNRQQLDWILKNLKQ